MPDRGACDRHSLRTPCGTLAPTHPLSCVSFHTPTSNQSIYHSSDYTLNHSQTFYTTRSPYCFQTSMYTVVYFHSYSY